jgi:hypothetical protein
MENAPSSIPESGSAAMRGQMPLHPPPQRPDRNERAAINSMPAVAPKDSSYMQQISNPSSLGPNRSGANESANAKVAIPRQRSTVAPRYSRRVPRACETCRARKTKCSGDTPICRQCKELRVTCRYPVSWREKTKGYVVGLSCCMGLQLIRFFFFFATDAGSWIYCRSRLKTMRISCERLGAWWIVELRSVSSARWTK